MANLPVTGNERLVCNSPQGTILASEVAALGLGPQGAPGATGATGATGAAGASYPHTVSATVTAAGTSSRTGATALVSIANIVTTTPVNSGVVLTSAATVGIGNWLSVWNEGDAAITVYGAGSDTIDGAAGTTGVILTNSKRSLFLVTAAATWLSAQLGAASA